MKADITVALLTLNAGPLFERVLQAVRAQETARRMELLAVDSGSRDETLPLLREFGARILTISPEHFDFGRTRDMAFEAAAGDIVISLSQDAIPAHGKWLENLVAPLEDANVAAACGRSIPDPERAHPQFPWEANGYFYFTREIRCFVRRYGRGLSNANSAIRREVWARLRFGAQPIGEDFLFQTKLHAEELRVAFPDDAPVLHHHDYTLGGLYRRCRNEGLGLRRMGCAYTEGDLARDMLSPRKYVVWARELARGRLRSPAALAFPVLRPVAVYLGSRFGREYLR